MSYPPRTRLGIIFALADECRGLERMLAQAHRHVRVDSSLSIWSIGNVELTLAVSGVGRRAAATTARRLIDDGARTIISAGLAAGLSPEAQIGNVITARNVILWNDQQQGHHQVSARITAALPPSGTLGIRISECDLVTTDSVICSADQKQAIFQSTNAAALDMESYAISEVCAASNIPFAAVRSISDTSIQDLPPQIQLLLTNSSLKRISVILAHPNIIPRLLTLRSQSQIAINNLAEVLAIFILRLI